MSLEPPTLADLPACSNTGPAGEPTACYLAPPPLPPDTMTTDITATLTERGQRYGRFTGHAEVTQDLKTCIRDHLRNRRKVLAADQREALDMITHKIGRIINGDPDYADSWHDIAGYAQLVADRLNGVER